MKKCPSYNENGFTLLELMVAISIIAIGMLAVATMQTVALRSNVVANRVSVDSFLAQQIAEEISSRDISDPILTSSSPGAVNYTFADWSSGSLQLVTTLPITGAGLVTATYDIDANTFNGSPVLGITRIQVTVTHNGYTTTYTTHKVVL